MFYFIVIYYIVLHCILYYSIVPMHRFRPAAHSNAHIVSGLSAAQPLLWEHHLPPLLRQAPQVLGEGLQVGVDGGDGGSVGGGDGVGGSVGGGGGDGVRGSGDGGGDEML